VGLLHAYEDKNFNFQKRSALSQGHDEQEAKKAEFTWVNEHF